MPFSYLDRLEDEQPDIVLGVSTRLGSHEVWRQIAESASDAASKFRDRHVQARADHQTRIASEQLGNEFRAVLVVVVATANAVEALDWETTGGSMPGLPLPDGRNKGVHIALRLSASRGLDDERTRAMVADLDLLFEQRNDLVHLKSVEQGRLAQHPVGTWTGLELAYFTVERAAECVRLLESIGGS